MNGPLKSTHSAGRLHVVVRQAHSTETNQTVLLLQMTARGPIGKDDSQDLKSGLDLGHQAAVSAFFALTSQPAKEHWGLNK